jgi:Zn-finger nucleic acid-binding protein
MATERQNNVDLNRCGACKGIYLSRGELERMVAAGPGVGDTFAFSPISDTMDEVPAHCFACDADMRPESGPADVRLDRCPKCGATFLDQGELATLQLEAT